ncbi:hypothetical protein [Sphingomonas bacterium]|uniref:hypothetical protein n=1 Tax=Sphingomonas bacterium TaxID=1895847 RepID=UPI001577487C|nr:hypothetical protein [Sphingomonas bacterium]
MGRVANRLDQLGSADRVVPVLFVLTIGTRLALMLLVPQRPVSDAQWYMVRAAEMARGLGYQEAGHPTAFWPVGYPALLAASLWSCGPSLLGPMLLNLAGAAATLALVLGFGRALGIDRTAARMAGLILAVYPASIAYAGQAMSETVATALGMSAFLLLIVGRHRAPLVLLAGIAFGLATLMRAQMLLFPAGAVIGIALACRDWRPRQALAAGLLCYAGLAATVLPWTWRNVTVMNAPVLVSTNGGVALYTGANDLADGDFMAVERTPLWAQVGIPFADRIARQVDIDDRYKALARAWIARHPARWLALGPRKVMLVWRKDSDAFWALEASYPERSRTWTIVAGVNQLGYLAVLALAAVSLVPAAIGAVRRGPAQPLALLVPMPVFVSATAFGFTGQTRYHAPAMPFLILAAGVTIVRVAARLRRSAIGIAAPPGAVSIANDRRA